MAKEGFDKAWLAGLKFGTSKKAKEGGFQKIEQDLQEKHVLDWIDNGETVTLVTADGRKHTVAKKKAAK